MAFSASDWRSRMQYYDGGYSSGYAWSGLGAAQGDRKYYMSFGLNYDNAVAYYTQCGTYYNCPAVEPFYVYSTWTIYYTVPVYYSTEFGYNYFYQYSGYYNNGSWYYYWPQSSYGGTLGYAYMPSPYTYSYYYSGFPYSYFSQYVYYYLSAGISSASPTTFYNYASGPYLSLYKYSLSNGTYTNYPYQRLYINGACA